MYFGRIQVRDETRCYRGLHKASDTSSKCLHQYPDDPAIGVRRHKLEVHQDHEASDQQNLIPTATSIFPQKVTLEIHDTISMSTTTNPEQAVAYAALILADDSITITPEKLQLLLKAAGIEDVEPIWTTLFAKALEGKSVNDILTSVEAPVVRSGECQTSDEHHECCNKIAKEGAKDGKGRDEDEESECDLTFDIFN